MPEEPRAPHAVEQIRRQLVRILESRDQEGRVVSTARWGVYCFYDYDGEPIYVGQTSEQLRVRIRRHLTNQRTDAVAMNVLDPFEVCDVEMWPLWEYQEVRSRSEEHREAVTHLDNLEFSVYGRVLTDSAMGAVLNEKDVAGDAHLDLPPSLRGSIIPPDIYPERKHADVRIARRAQTIASLAKVISEREVSSGLRRTLVTQARRLEALSTTRFRELGGKPPREVPGEETGE